jgi:mono/diheme cytochrome c family protein
VLVIFLLYTGQTDKYVPETSDPSRIYKEACVGCHGEQGKGEGILYPDLSKESLSEEGVINIVRNGEFFMPSFPYIPDSTLINLADYVSGKKFLNKKKLSQ